MEILRSLRDWTDGGSQEKKHDGSSTSSSTSDLPTVADEEKDSCSRPEGAPPSLTTVLNQVSSKEEIIYPEGGRDAWLVVLGAFCGLTASLGVYNTSGVFSAIIAQTILPGYDPSTLGWLFSTYAFVNWFAGVQIGPTFDAMGPRALIIAGTVCTVAGIFTLSVSTEFHQILLSFSILTGIGSSLLSTPSMGCIAHWFMERRGLASGIAFIGGGFGGVLFPLMTQSLLPRVGWGWCIRILGFVLLVLCAISIAFCRSRVPPRQGANISWRDTVPDPKIFVDGTGAMAFTTAGVLLTDMAYFIPVTYAPSYYIARQSLSEEAMTGSAAFAYQLLAILNAASCVGRAVAGHVADKFGQYNTMIISLLFYIISVLAFWLPDILVLGLSNDALLIVFVALFGFISCSNVSLTPICLGQLCDTREYGRYYASCFTVVSFGVLISIPIAGGLLGAVDEPGKQRYWGAALFTGLSYVASFLCFVWVRISVKGWRWRTIW